MPFYFPTKPDPPTEARGATYRGQMSFTQRINYAKGIRATTAQEATQLIPLINELLKQVSKFITSQSTQEAYSATKSELADVHGSLPVITGPTHATDLPQTDGSSGASEFPENTEPFPDDDEGYSDADKQERVEELQEALRKGIARDNETAVVPTPKKRGRPKKK